MCLYLKKQSWNGSEVFDMYALENLKQLAFVCSSKIHSWRGEQSTINTAYSGERNENWDHPFNVKRSECVLSKGLEYDNDVATEII